MTTEERGCKKTSTQGTSLGARQETLKHRNDDNKKESRTNETNNLLTELSATQEPKLLQPRPSSAKSTTKITDITDTISLTTLDMTQVTPTMITTITTTGTEGPRESATMTTEKMTP